MTVLNKKNKPNQKNANDLLEVFDGSFYINGEADEGRGEDSFSMGFNEKLGYLGTFDGCGGMGARKYEQYQNHSGAYIASRIVAGALEIWFDWISNQDQSEKEIDEQNIKRFLKKVLGGVKAQGARSTLLGGSMSKEFPTTAAWALVRRSQNKLNIKAYWAGDSRVFLINRKGMCQLSIDDVTTNDAMENLQQDGVLTNVVSASHDFEIHSEVIKEDFPCIVLSATDGCFGYWDSPMMFEYLILDSLRTSKNILEWKKSLIELFKEYSGDDYTLCLACFGFGEFAKLQTFFENRIKQLKDQFIDPFSNADDKEKMKLWEVYKQNYYLK